MSNAIPTLFELFLKNTLANEHQQLLSYKYSGNWLHLSYSQGMSRIISAIRYFQKIKIKKGDKIVVFAENQPEYLFTYLAINAIGAVAIPLGSLYSHKTIKDILNFSKAQYLIYKQEFKAEILSIDNNKTKKIILHDLFQDMEHFAINHLPVNLPTLTTKNPCFIYYEASEQGLQQKTLTNSNIFTYIESVSNTYDIKINDKILSLIQLKNTAAYLSTLFLPIKQGSSYIIPVSLEPDSITEAIAKYSPSIIISNLSILSFLYKKLLTKIKSFGNIAIYLFFLFSSLSLFCEQRKLPNPYKILFKPLRNKLGKGLNQFLLFEPNIRNKSLLRFKALGFKAANIHSYITSINRNTKITKFSYRISAIETSITIQKKANFDQNKIYALKKHQIAKPNSKLKTLFFFLLKVFNKIHYLGKEALPFNAPYILYLESDLEDAFLWTLTNFPSNIRNNIYTVNNLDKKFSKLIKKTANVLKEKSNYKNLYDLDIINYLLKNHKILYLQSNKNSKMLPDVIKLAHKMKCPLIPINIMYERKKNIFLRDTIKVQFNKPISESFYYLNPCFKNCSKKEIEEKINIHIKRSLKYA
ncbi:AMP-binding protein [Candidatus Margulisiibacteriota bacterium]